jgi:hypothetical protein
MIHGLLPSKKQRVENVVAQIALPKCPGIAVREKGPRAALDDANLATMNPKNNALWLQDARVMAVLGSSAKTLPSVGSAVRCYMALAVEKLGICLHVKCHAISMQGTMTQNHSHRNWTSCLPGPRCFGAKAHG